MFKTGGENRKKQGADRVCVSGKHVSHLGMLFCVSAWNKIIKTMALMGSARIMPQ